MGEEGVEKGAEDTPPWCASVQDEMMRGLPSQLDWPSGIPGIFRGPSPRGWGNVYASRPVPRTNNRNPIAIVKIYRVQAGDLQGPDCFSRDSYYHYFLLFFFVQNDHIFHCLNTPQNSPNLEFKSHLVKNVIIYCPSEFRPLGGAVIMENRACTHYCKNA